MVRNALVDRLEKRTLELTVIAVILASVLVGVGASEVLKSGNPSGKMLAHYSFDQGAGETAYDSSNNSNDGTLENFDFDADSGWTEGVNGKALEFDGNDDKVDINGFMHEGSITFSFWVKKPDGTWGDNAEEIIFLGDGSPQFEIMDRGGNFRFIYWDGSNNQGITSLEEHPSTGNWNHVSTVFNYSNNKWKVYYNGEKVASKTQTPNFQGATGTDSRIGYHPSSGRPLDGTLDDIRIYKKALTESEVKVLSNRGGLRSGQEENKTGGKVLDIDFDRKNSSHVFDTSGENNHGQPQSGAEQKSVVHCRVGRCYSMNADGNGYVSTSWGADLGYQDFTAMAWFKPDESRSTIEKIIGSDRGGNTGLTISNNQQDRITWSLDGNPEYVGLLVDSGTWQHVALVRKNNITTLYFDGINRTSRTLVGNIDDTTTLNIGAQGDENRKFNGSIDEVKVFDRALTQKEIVKEAGIREDGAILDLRMDTESGGTAYDSSFQDQDGSLKPDADTGPNWVEGVSGEALEFEAGGDAVKVPGYSGTNADDVTYSYWAYFPTTQSNTYARTIQIGGDVGSRPGSGISHEVNPSGNGAGVIRFVHWSGDYYEVGTATLQTGRWHHIVHSASGNDAKIFIDGEKAVDASAGRATGGSQPVIAGNGGGNTGFEGKIDLVKGFPYQLSENKVQELYRQGSSKVGKPDYESDDWLEEDLVVYYPFDNFNGTRALDKSGKNNFGANVGALERKSDQCRVGRCLQMDGSGDYLNVSKRSSPDWNTEYSVGGWIKTSDTTNSGSGGTPEGNVIVGRNDGVSNVFFFEVTGGELKLYDGSSRINSGEFVADGIWHHVGFTYNGSSVKIFVDGEIAKETSTTITEASDTDTVWIGMELDEGVNDPKSQFFDGRLDQVRVYNRSLSEQEMWKLYSKGRDRLGNNEMAGPIAWYRMDSGEGQIVSDYTGEGNDGTRGNDSTSESNDPEWSSNCRRNGCLEFNPVNNEIINISGSKKLKPDKLTYTAWIKTATNNPSTFMSIYSKDSNGPWSKINIKENPDVLRGTLTAEGTTVDVDGSTDIADSEWHFVAMTYDGSVIKIYVDGAVEAKDGSLSGDLSYTEENARIGARSSGSVIQNYFNGTIDDVRIYPYALTGDQVRQVMDRGGVSVG